jgi:hypothetical protein
MLVATRSTPMRRAASAVSSRPRAPATATPALRAARRPRPRPSVGAGSRDGRRFAGRFGPPSIRTRPVRDPRPRVALGAPPARRAHRGHPRRLVREQLELLGERLRVCGRHEDAVDAVGHDIAVAGDLGGDHRRAGRHRLDQDHAEALPGQRRGAEDVRLANLTPEDRVGDLAEDVDVGHQLGVRHPPGDLLRVGADHRQPGRDVLDERLERREEDREALALLGPADEQQPQLVAGRLRPLRCGVDVDTVRHDGVLPAEPAAAGPGGGLRDGDPGRELVEPAAGAEQGGGVVWEGLGRVGMEGPDHRGATEDHRVPPDDRCERLVDVDDVVVPGAQRAPERDRPPGEDGEVGDGPVGADAQRAPERNEVVRSLPQLGLGAVQAAADRAGRIPRGQHTDVVTTRHELLRERLDVPIHTSRISPGIRRDERDAHQVRVPSWWAVLGGGSHTWFTTRRSGGHYAGNY